MNSVGTTTLGLIADQLACNGETVRLKSSSYRTVEDSMAFEFAGRVNNKPS